MNAPLIKICGLTTEESIDAAIDAGADLLGFVFVEKSSRYVSPDRARALVEHVVGRAGAVGLWQDGDAETIASICRNVGLTHVQWHGPVDDGSLTALRAKTALPVIAAHSVGTLSDMREAALAPLRDAESLLFDARPPAGEDVAGGHGRPFDWSILAAYRGGQDWLLAGGLTPENVAEAIGAVRHIPGFAGVDVSSGVERARGEKDLARIAAFVRAARAAMAAA